MRVGKERKKNKGWSRKEKGWLVLGRLFFRIKKEGERETVSFLCVIQLTPTLFYPGLMRGTHSEHWGRETKQTLSSFQRKKLSKKLFFEEKEKDEHEKKRKRRF